jgi:hypothetical protein
MCSCNMKKAKREKKVKSATRIHPSCVHSSREQLFIRERGRGILCDEQVKHVCRTTVFFRLSPFKIICTIVICGCVSNRVHPIYIYTIYIYIYILVNHHRPPTGMISQIIIPPMKRYPTTQLYMFEN